MEFPYTEAQTAWLDELATTAKPQCNGVLRSEDGFCCLGIALDLRGDGGWSTICVSGNKVHGWALGAAAGWTKESGRGQIFTRVRLRRPFPWMSPWTWACAPGKARSMLNT